MKKNRKYDTSGLIEAQYEPLSRRLVLKNLLGIRKKSEMDRIETLALKQAEDELVKHYGASHRFTAGDICRIHKLWLGRIYPWAGSYRQVNLSKGGFPFAAAAHIPQLMSEFESSFLTRDTPCRFKEHTALVKALAQVHVELVLIHPFREGNGRLGRLLSTLMALQAGLPPLDFSVIKGKKINNYFEAIRVGLNKDYSIMESLFSEIIEVTFSRQRGK